MQESVLKFASSTAAPTQVDSHISMLQKGTNWIISASGGVNISPGQIAGKARESSTPAEARGHQVRMVGPAVRRSPPGTGTKCLSKTCP